MKALYGNILGGNLRSSMGRDVNFSNNKKYFAKILYCTAFQFSESKNKN
jgi:hypothetical protein